MCALSSSLRGTIRRRSKASIGLTPNFFESTTRSFSTTSIQEAEENSGSKRVGGFLSRLKNIFNRDVSSHEVHDTIANRQSTLARPTRLENTCPNRQINQILRSSKRNDVDRDFIAVEVVSKTSGTTGKTEGKVNSVFKVNLKKDKCPCNLEGVYDLQGYDDRTRLSLFANDSSRNSVNDLDPWNQQHFLRTRSLFSYDMLHSNVENPVDSSPVNNFVPRVSKPPIREPNMPNMPEKRDKKEEEKEKKEKKPVIRTNDQYADITKRFLKNDFGQITQYASNLATTGNLTHTSNMSISKRTVFLGTSTFKEMDSTSVSSNPNTKPEVTLNPNIPDRKRHGKMSLEAAKRADKSREEVKIFDDSPPLDTEISAWQTLVEKSKPPPEKKVEQELFELQLDKVSIRPEPPQPKLDVEVVKPLDTIRKEEEELTESSTDRKNMRSSEGPRAGTPMETQKLDSRKYHTFSQILPRRRFSNSTSTPSQLPTDSESVQRPNTQNQQLSKTKVQSDQNAFARSAAREPENTTEGSSNEGKRSSLSADFQSTNRKHEEAGRNSSGTSEVNLSSQKEGRSSSSSRGKQERAGERQTEDEIFHSQQYGEYPYTGVNVASHDEYPYACFDESYSGENKYIDAKRDLEERAEREMSKENEAMEASREDDTSEITENEIELRMDEDYVRLPGDPYPYSREHFNKWRLPRRKTFEDTILKTLGTKENPKTMSEEIRAQTVPILGTTTLKNIEGKKSDKEKQPIREMSHDSHAREKTYCAVRLDDRESSKKRRDVRLARKIKRRKFYASLLSQQIVPECLRRGVIATNERDELGLGKLMEEISMDRNFGMDDLKYRWTVNHGFRKGNGFLKFSLGSRNRKEAVEVHNPIKSRSVPGHSLDLKDKSDKFEETKDLVPCDKTINPCAKPVPPPSPNKTDVNVDCSEEKVANLVQQQQFTQASSTQEEKELNVVTQLKEAPSVTTEEVQRTYERKNYSYLKTEEIKDTRPIKIKIPKECENETDQVRNADDESKKD